MSGENRTEGEKIETGEALKDIIGKRYVEEIRRCTFNGEYIGDPEILHKAQLYTDPLYAPFLDGSWRAFLKPSELEIKADKE